MALSKKTPSRISSRHRAHFAHGATTLMITKLQTTMLTLTTLHCTLMKYANTLNNSLTTKGHHRLLDHRIKRTQTSYVITPRLLCPQNDVLKQQSQINLTRLMIAWQQYRYALMKDPMQTELWL